MTICQRNPPGQEVAGNAMQLLSHALSGILGSSVRNLDFSIGQGNMWLGRSTKRILAPTYPQPVTICSGRET